MRIQETLINFVSMKNKEKSLIFRDKNKTFVLSVFLLRGNATSFRLFFSSLRAVILQKVERLIVCVKHDIKIARASEKASESSLKSLTG